MPFFTALIAWTTGGNDRPDARSVAGLVIGFLGVVFLVGFDVAADDLAAVAEVLLVALGYATGTTIIARKLSDLPAIGVVVASLALTAFSWAPLAVAQMPAGLPPPGVLGAVAVLGVVCTGIAFVVYFALIAEVGPARATVITYVNPAVALALGVVLLAEPFTIPIAVGFVLIVLGSFLATRRGSRPRRSNERVGAPGL